ncbi:hypothetical protein M083_2595 [Bacteroides fragilis str. 3986 T(B)9]|uniref:Uncharacterized protein n=6 Tax=Bacteroides fragilis TaxID=817 RepID=A0A015U0D3_BACFG|nr:hypothetical protein M080_2539 [Bacteroides fragilis str. 3397 T10]EXY50725.1 hypothetical protein M121_2488 [Bacteroides fragilis str. 3783N2-1]EXY55537.1 hypothetical protein M122_2434 [Bacteroides fragilis str. 3976T7]EXY60120.1 hypothetical protein M111_2340 [Bacteroides fragilis str. 3986T(B)10]EXY69853.1 hypothetical protein M083_2595 [Bacteroides fragilis str. 3986 T(B)9]EXY73917.1 hypothetical protein M124_2322 [Bacteroides fragilis str. 3988T(B)14]EXY79942.1 hypothetical protein M
MKINVSVSSYPLLFDDSFLDNEQFSCSFLFYYQIEFCTFGENLIRNT